MHPGSNPSWSIMFSIFCAKFSFGFEAHPAKHRHVRYSCQVKSVISTIFSNFPSKLYPHPLDIPKPERHALRGRSQLWWHVSELSFGTSPASSAIACCVTLIQFWNQPTNHINKEKAWQSRMWRHILQTEIPSYPLPLSLTPNFFSALLLL